MAKPFNFHTTALCSPTRSCLMTGRNHTTNGMATITEAATFGDADADAKTDKQIQFYSMGGTRAIWHQGWKAVSVTPSAPDMWAHYTYYPGGSEIPDTLTLHIRDKAAGEGHIRTQPGKFSIAGEGLNIGKEGAEPVTDDYPGDYPWAFVGGTIRKTMIDVSGDPFVDLAEEARMAFARD